MDQHLQQQQEESCVPPGFRFHPTEEELVGYYLARKMASQKIDLDIIQEVDLYRIEPWDLQERCGRGGGGGAQAVEDGLPSSSSEWYFFSFKDRKYPSGTRTNRATAAGFWKATGRDKPVLSSSRRPGRGVSVIGMRKTLVFYKGRAPNGRKTEWIIHEYRLQSDEHAPTQEEGWVVCRAFQKPAPSQRSFVFPAYEYATAPGYYAGTLPHLHGHGGDLHPVAAGVGGFTFPAGQGEDFESKHNLFSNIPQLIESPPTTSTVCGGDGIDQHGQVASAVDWNFLDSLLSTSLLHDPASVSAASQLYHGIE